VNDDFYGINAVSSRAGLRESGYTRPMTRFALVLALLIAGCSPAEPAMIDDDPPAPDAPPAITDTREPFEVWRHREPIYELYIRHFSETGNFEGVRARLPELKALGIGIVWLLPIHEIGSIDRIDAPHGNPYAVKSYERLNAEYGTEDEFRALVRDAHALGMSVIVDWVPNHTAWDSELITAHPDWYVRRDGQIQPVGGEFDWIAQLDWSNHELRAYMTGVMVDWVRRFDFDGFRIDFAHHMPVDYFVELRAALEAVKPVFLLAEAGEPRFHDAFDMTYDWSVYPVFGDVAHGARTVTAIDDALLHQQLIPYANRPSALSMRMTYNHDDNGKFTLAQRYREGIKTFAVLACTLPGKPMVFDGQEVGMQVFDGTTVRDSINLGHDPRVKIDWTDAGGYRPFYTKLLQLHRANPALHQPGMADFRKLDIQPGDRVYAFVRRAGDNAVVVVLNLSADATSVTLTPQPNAGSIEGTYLELFTEQYVALHAGQTMTLAPWEYRVYVRGPHRSE
jgi:glycosidase